MTKGHYCHLSSWNKREKGHDPQTVVWHFPLPCEPQNPFGFFCVMCEPETPLVPLKLNPKPHPPQFLSLFLHIDTNPNPTTLSVPNLLSLSLSLSSHSTEAPSRSLISVVEDHKDYLSFKPQSNPPSLFYFCDLIYYSGIVPIYRSSMIILFWPKLPCYS